MPTRDRDPRSAFTKKLRWTQEFQIEDRKEAFPHVSSSVASIPVLPADGQPMSGWVSPAQSFVLDLPLPGSPGGANFHKRIGITDITISYHRPLVNDRKVLGCSGSLWPKYMARREPTKIRRSPFSDPVMIEGKPLDKGTYGLHMIPNADEWTIIFSKNSTSWGSFTYDEKEDALRRNGETQGPQTCTMR